MIAVDLSAFNAVDCFVFVTLGLIALLGSLALVMPNAFSRLAQTGARWVDTEKLIEKLDQRVDVDQHVLRHSRLLGAAVIASAVFLTYCYVRVPL